MPRRRAEGGGRASRRRRIRRRARTEEGRKYDHECRVDEGMIVPLPPLTKIPRCALSLEVNMLMDFGIG